MASHQPDQQLPIRSILSVPTLGAFLLIVMVEIYRFGLVLVYSNVIDIIWFLFIWMCVRACVRVGVCAYVFIRILRMCMCVCACVLLTLVRNGLGK